MSRLEGAIPANIDGSEWAVLTDGGGAALLLRVLACQGQGAFTAFGMKTVMTSRGHLAAILSLGLPLIGGHVAQFAIQLTDTIMLGWYSVEALAAVVLGSSFFFVLFILESGFAIAVMPLVAEASAEGDETALRRATRMGCGFR